MRGLGTLKTPTRRVGRLLAERAQAVAIRVFDDVVSRLARHPVRTSRRDERRLGLGLGIGIRRAADVERGERWPSIERDRGSDARIPELLPRAADAVERLEISEARASNLPCSADIPESHEGETLERELSFLSAVDEVLVELERATFDVERPLPPLTLAIEDAQRV